jgi:hypothetical protein
VGGGEVEVLLNGLSGPFGLFFYGGSIYVAERTGGMIKRITLQG